MSIADDILCCPACKGPLAGEGPEFTCRPCGATYREREGFTDLIPTGADSLKLSERSHYTEKVDYYLRMHATWCTSPFYRHFHDSFLDELRRLPTGSVILETGCGLGNDGLRLLASGYRLVETDISPGQLAEARRLHENRGLAGNSAHLLADAENLPFTSGSFDGAYMVASLHHLPDPLKALREMRRILRPGGILVLGTEPNTWQNRTIYPLGKLILRSSRRLRGKSIDAADMVSEADKLTEGFSYLQLDRLLRDAGFDRRELKPAGYLSAAIFFFSTELSQYAGRDVRLFALERLALPVDEILGKIPLVDRYPWHWNAVAR